MTLRAVLAAAALLAAASAASAQSSSGAGPAPQPGVPPPRKKGDAGPVFSPPGEGADAEPARPEKPPEPPKSDLQKAMDSLAGWPSPEARSAVDWLVARWTEAKPALLAALGARPSDGRLLPGAAAAFQRAGDTEGLPVLLAAVREPKGWRAAAEVIDAAVALDPVGLRDRLLPLLSVPCSAVVERAARAVRPALGPEDAPRLLDLAGSKSASTRRAALGLVSEVDLAAARVALLRALGDPAPEVAQAAAAILGTRGDASLRADLNAAARGTDARAGAYAVVALSLLTDGLGTSAMDDATVAAILGSRGLRSADPLNRAVAALALADIGYRTADPVVDPLLEKEVVPALLEVVAGARFFPDLVTLRPLVLSRLRRLCAGTEDLQTSPDWSAWWESRTGTFVARRVLTSIPPGSRGALRLRVAGPAAGTAGPAVYAASAAEVPSAGGAGGRFVLLSPEEADRAARAVEESGLLTLPEPSALGEAASLEVAVDVGNRGHVLRFPAGAAVPPGIEGLLRVLAEVRAANRWQRYWDHRVAPIFADFVAGERPAWAAGGAADGDRATRLLRLASGAAVDLPEEDRLDTLQEMLQSPTLRGALRPEDASALASLAVVDPRLGASGEAALRVLAAAGRPEGLSCLRARLETTDTPAERSALEGILEETFAAAPPGLVLDAAAQGEGVAVRCAAVRSLGGRGGDEAAAKAVLAATSAPEAPVRAAAYRALGRLRLADAGTALRFALENETETAAKAGAIEGLGSLGGADVVPVLGRASQSPDPRLRAAAVRALAATREPEALPWVLSLLSSDADPGVREESDRAVRSVGGDRAREALRSLALDRRRPGEIRVRAIEGLGVLGAEQSGADLHALLEDPDAEVADAAAFALAWVRDGDAAPRLLEALRAGRSPARTLRCLELLSLESFRQVKDREEAVALYTGWYELSRPRGPRGWLAEALTTRGFADASIRGFEDGKDPRAAVPALLRALAERNWALRRAANLELRRISGKDLGEIDPWTPEEKALAIATAWGEWWDREKGASR
jgi:HEAT repeat protein